VQANRRSGFSTLIQPLTVNKTRLYQSERELRSLRAESTSIGP
jgi:hypothetical protein